MTLKTSYNFSPHQNHPIKSLIFFVSFLVLSITSALISATSLPSSANIRIQVNNENLQSPPYLLDAIKQVEAAEQKSALTLASPSNNESPVLPITSTQPFDSSELVQSNAKVEGSVSKHLLENQPLSSEGGGDKLLQATALPVQDDAYVYDDSRAAAESLLNDSEFVAIKNNFSNAVREETIEDMLNLEPDSVLRLSPESVLGAVAGSVLDPTLVLKDSVSFSGPQAATSTISAIIVANSNSPDLLKDVTPAATTTISGDDNLEFKPAKQFQLPVTSSHLKRPLFANTDKDQFENEEVESDSKKKTTNNDLNSQQSESVGSGAKSRVSPSVSSDDDDPPQIVHGASSINKKSIPNQPPDLWEPDQVMQDIKNVSHVPATIRKQYGHQTRTRITLGGGYQREKQPEIPQSSETSEQQPKPALASTASTRRPSANRDHPAAGSSLENSRIIEVPKRIVLSDGIFKQQEKPSMQNVTSTVSQSIVKKRDKRCPSNGMTSLEHPEACDKYYLCEDGYSSERVCPNGLMYGTRDIVRDFCVHRWQTVCGEKSIPNPISSPGCRWQNGIFNVQGSPKCTPDFYECTNGLFEVKKCSISGQVYDDKTKSCQFAEQVGCAQEALAEFRCPPDDQTNTYWPFPRYFLNERALIHCINDKPEIIRCRDHERVDTENLFCVPIDKSASVPDDSGGPAGPEMVVSARRAAAINKREKGKKVQPANKSTSELSER